ncbi:MAG: c-type cytochrome [Sulfurovum sp.]|nr:c-type cytochrome [Sulfurovum sp.]
MRERISKYIVLLTSVLIVALSILFALSQNQDRTETKNENEIKKDISLPESLKTITLDLEKIQKGKEVFSAQGCARCHSIEGKGNRRNPLDGVGDKLEEKTLEAWIIAADSVKDKMPERAFEQKQKYKQLTFPELEALVEYMQSLRSEIKETVENKKSTDVILSTTKEGVEPDVHFEAGMHCLDCHKNDMHGDGTSYTSRGDVKGRPQCTDCHDALPNSSTPQHNTLHKNVSCQVCHAQPYQNCFGKNQMPNFDKYPTWKTIAPHNIRRITPQNSSCQNCHGNKKLFLQKEDLDENGSKP